MWQITTYSSSSKFTFRPTQLFYSYNIIHTHTQNSLGFVTIGARDPTFIPFLLQSCLHPHYSWGRRCRPGFSTSKQHICDVSPSKDPTSYDKHIVSSPAVKWALPRRPDVPPLVPADHGVVIRSASQQSLDKIMCFPANSHPQLSQLVGGIVRLVAHGVMHFDREA